ncbi:MAG: endonuclease III [Candidatus Gracilibacteria bacterium]|jgi:endonuclease-3
MDKTRGLELVALLTREFPKVAPFLHARSAFELLVAVILSAQCTDERVNRITKNLFPCPPAPPLTPANILDLGQEKLKKIIFSAGYYNSKSKAIYGCAKALQESGKSAGTSADSTFPRTLSALTALPGVGPKTAQVVLGQWFHIPSFPVDTHVHRVANRLGLTHSGNNRAQTEKDLKHLIPRTLWIEMHLRLIMHGRKTCTARVPACGACPLFHLCSWPKKNLFSLFVSSPDKHPSHNYKKNNRPSK